MSNKEEAMYDDTFYHKLTYKDCLGVATKDEAAKLQHITMLEDLIILAERWCRLNGFRLGGYLGWSKKDGYSWDATRNKEAK